MRVSPRLIQRRFFYNRTQVCTCTVPKAASTSVNRLMLMAEFPENAEFYRTLPGNKVHTIKMLENFQSERCSEKPGISFFIARDPYARLYSAYLDKVFLEKFGTLAVFIDAMFSQRIPKDAAVRIASVKQTAEDNHWMCNAANVSFEQFLHYVSKTRHLDPHYTPVSLLCNPCKDPVDYIFKQETLEEDSQYLFEYLNMSLKSRAYENIQLHLKDYTGDNGLENLIKTVTVAWRVRLKNFNCVLTPETRDVFYRRLWKGLKMLGNIDDDLEYMPEIFKGSETELQDPDVILEAFSRYGIGSISQSRRSSQRRSYLVGAYNSVSRRVIKSIQNLFKLDFEFFQYDTSPPS